VALVVEVLESIGDRPGKEMADVIEGGDDPRQQSDPVRSGRGLYEEP
jgi:hypothetical protein